MESWLEERSAKYSSRISFRIGVSHYFTSFPLSQTPWSPGDVSTLNHMVATPFFERARHVRGFLDRVVWSLYHLHYHHHHHHPQRKKRLRQYWELYYLRRYYYYIASHAFRGRLRLQPCHFVFPFSLDLRLLFLAVVVIHFQACTVFLFWR